MHPVITAILIEVAYRNSDPRYGGPSREEWAAAAMVAGHERFCLQLMASHWFWRRYNLRARAQLAALRGAV